MFDPSLSSCFIKNEPADKWIDESSEKTAKPDGKAVGITRTASNGLEFVSHLGEFQAMHSRLMDIAGFVELGYLSIDVH